MIEGSIKNIHTIIGKIALQSTAELLFFDKVLTSSSYNKITFYLLNISIYLNKLITKTKLLFFINSYKLT